MSLPPNNRVPVEHPGPFLYRELKEAKIKQTELAAAMNVARPNLTVILSGRRSITANMALKIEAALGVSADTLVAMQAAYDLAQANANRQAIVADVIPIFGE